MTSDATDFGIVDVNAQIGPRHGQAAGAPLEDLQRERRAHGVRLSLTRHRNAIWAEASAGNEELLEAAQSDPGIVPVAALTIDRTDRYLQRPASLRVARRRLLDRGDLRGPRRTDRFGARREPAARGRPHRQAAVRRPPRTRRRVAHRRAPPRTSASP